MAEESELLRNSVIVLDEFTGFYTDPEPSDGKTARAGKEGQRVCHDGCQGRFLPVQGCT